MDQVRSDEILDIVARETNVPRHKLQLDATMESLAIPSLDMVQAIFALESHYDIEIPVAQSQAGPEFSTVGDLVTHVSHAIDASHAATAGVGAD